MRRIVGLAVVVASLACTAVPTFATAAAPYSQSCALNDDAAKATVQTQGKHAVAGTWRLAPILTCTQAEQGLSLTVSLMRNGKTLLSSQGQCSGLVPACTTVSGPARTKKLGTSIRGSYVLHMTVAITGPDAMLFQNCSYDALAQTATCTSDSDPTVIR